MFKILWMRSFAVIARILGKRDRRDELAIRGHRNSRIFRGLAQAFHHCFGLIYSLYFLCNATDCKSKLFCLYLLWFGAVKLYFLRFLGGGGGVMKVVVYLR